MPCGCAVINPTFIAAGSGVTVTGTGTETNPYRIGAATSEASLIYRETTTAKMTRTGSGTVAAPYELKTDVKLDPQGGLGSAQSGIGIQIDGNAGNILTLTQDGKLRASGSAAVLVRDDGGIQDTDLGLAIKLDPNSPVPIVGTTDGLRVGPVDATGPATTVNSRVNALQQITRHQNQLTAGGSHRANMTHVWWSSSFYAIAPRKSGLQSASFYQIDVPAAGTVITGIGGATNKTIPASGNYANMIPLGDWESIWYILPTTNAAGTSVPGNFRAVGYSAVSDLPDTAILICYRTGTSDKTVIWGDGQISVPWNLGANPLSAEGQGGSPGALNLGSGGTQALWWRVIDGMLEVDLFAVWGSGATSAPGDLYWDLPAAAKTPAHNLNRIAHNQLGWGKFFTSASGSKPAMDWNMIPYIANNSQRIYFNVPAAGNDARLRRMRIWNGTNGTGTGFPYVAEGQLDTMSSELQGGLRFPFEFPYHP